MVFGSPPTSSPPSHYGSFPSRRRRSAGLIVIFALGIFIVNGALYNGLIAFANWSFSGADHETPDGIEQPMIAERSGSPMSAEAWDSLGQEGRTFMGSGPTAAEISALTGREAKQPIRVYAGRESSDSINGVSHSGSSTSWSAPADSTAEPSQLSRPPAAVG